MASRLFIGLFFLAIGAVFFVQREVHQYDRRIVSEVEVVPTDDWPRPRVAIVFGASVLGNRQLSPVLADRVETAIQLYRARKVDQILVSGDNRHPNYNEPRAMQEYLIARSIPGRDILLDPSGRSTFETCLRARTVYGLTRAVLVTQQFHLPRALYIANQLGVEAIGMAGTLRPPLQVDYQSLRELAAEFKAVYNIRLFPPPGIEANPLQLSRPSPGR
jgi:SanA protein